MMRKMLNNKKGFTLIELIVVIAIIAILAAVAVPKLSGFQDSAKDKRDLSNIKLSNNLSQIYNAEKGDYYDLAGGTASYADFVDEMVDEDYLTDEEGTNLKNAGNWSDDSLPSYTEETGLVTDIDI